MFGGGFSKLGPCCVVSLYGFNSELWNTGCIFQLSGNFNRQLVEEVHNTLNGPYRRGASLCFGWVVCRFVPSSQTCSPCVKVCVANSGPRLVISFAANCRAAVTSFRICSRYLTRSSAFWFLVWRYGGG